jgi:hypothetical protein
MYSRRQFGAMTLSGAAISALSGSALWGAPLDSTDHGVKLGLITGTLNPLAEVPGKDPIDVIIGQSGCDDARGQHRAGHGGRRHRPQVTGGGRLDSRPPR